MGAVNAGILAGGIAKGWSQGINDQAKQNDSDWQKSERARVDKARKQDEEINATLSAEMKDMLRLSEPAGEPSIAATGVNGVTTPSDQPAPPMAQGISQPATEKPKYRSPTVDDMARIAQRKVQLSLESGNYNGALAAHTDAMAFASEKLKKEEAGRQVLGEKAIQGIAMGDYSGLTALYDTFPDGKKLSGVTTNKDGTISITLKDSSGKELEPKTFPNVQYLNAAVMTMVDTNKSLDALDKAGKQEIERAKQLEDARHNKEGEDIDRTKADAELIKAKTGSDEKATAEMKNAKAFFPDLPPAEGLKKFRALLEKEGALTQSSDGFGGINVIDHRTNEIYNLRNGKKTIMQAGEANAARNPAAQGIKQPGKTPQKPLSAF